MPRTTRARARGGAAPARPGAAPAPRRRAARGRARLRAASSGKWAAASASATPGMPRRTRARAGSGSIASAASAARLPRPLADLAGRGAARWPGGRGRSRWCGGPSGASAARGPSISWASTRKPGAVELAVRSAAAAPGTSLSASHAWLNHVAFSGPRGVGDRRLEDRQVAPPRGPHARRADLDQQRRLALRSAAPPPRDVRCGRGSCAAGAAAGRRASRLRRRRRLGEPRVRRRAGW